MADNRNIQDRYKGWHEDLIREDLKSASFPFAVLMEHLQGDFNIGTIVRTANAMGAEKMFYTGKKKWDKRGAVGTHNYTMVEYLNDYWHVQRACEDGRYTLVGLEICEERGESLYDFEWPARPMIVVGEEGGGLSYEMWEGCQHIVEIPQYGSVRSMNAATAAGIAMYDYVCKYQRQSIKAVKEITMGSIKEDNGVSLKDALESAAIDARFDRAIKALGRKRRETLLPLLEMMAEDSDNQTILEGIEATFNDRAKQKTET